MKLSPIFSPPEHPVRAGWYPSFESYEDAKIAWDRREVLYDDTYIHYWDMVSEQWFMSDLMVREIQNQKQFWFGWIPYTLTGESSC